MNTEPSVKVRKRHKPVYPDYISVEMLDSVIKSGTNPVTMMQEMKKALMERVMEAELNHHLKHEKHDKSQDGNYRNGYSKKSVCMDDGELGMERDKLEGKLKGKYKIAGKMLSSGMNMGLIAKITGISHKKLLELA